MNLLLNYATIYKDIIAIGYIGNIMKKVCSMCSIPKLLTEFYTRHNSCKECWNASRRNSYKKAVCRECLVEFRPGVEGRYKFCSEVCRFMNKVQKDELSGCWIWKGHIQSKKGGYGTFVPIGERSGLAHRVSYRLFKGKLRDDRFILHSCHNTICVNPSHLRMGTPMDNANDRKKRLRGELILQEVPSDVIQF